MESFNVLISKEGDKIPVPKNDKLFKKSVFKYLDFGENIPLDYKTLYNLFHYKFKDFSYSYEDMIKHTNSTFMFVYPKHEKKCKKYIEKILIKHDALYYYKYHIKIFFKDNDIDFIVNNFPNFNSFYRMITTQNINNDKIIIRNYEKYHRNIINRSNCKLFNFDNEFVQDFIETVSKDDILMYHILKNKSFEIDTVVKFIPFLSKKLFNILLSGYNFLEYFNFETPLYEINKQKKKSGKKYLMLQFLKKYFKNGFKEEYDKLTHNKINVGEHLIGNCLYIMVKYHHFQDVEFLNYLYNDVFELSSKIKLFFENYRYTSYKLSERMVNEIINRGIAYNNGSILSNLIKNSAQFNTSYFDKLLSKNVNYNHIFKLIVSIGVKKNYKGTTHILFYKNKLKDDILSYFLDKLNYETLDKETILFLIMQEKWYFFSENRLSLFNSSNEEPYFEDAYIFETKGYEIDYSKLFKNLHIPKESILPIFKHVSISKKSIYRSFYGMVDSGKYHEYYHIIFQHIIDNYKKIHNYNNQTIVNGVSLIISQTNLLNENNNDPKYFFGLKTPKDLSKFLQNLLKT